MPTYRYRCAEHGDFDSSHPITEVPDRRPCVRCASAAVRVFTPPGLLTTSATVAAAMEIHARSATVPAVATREAARVPMPEHRGRRPALPRP